MADASFDDLEIEHFINEIANQPLIWCTTDANYHDYVKKREAWMSISRKFTNDFNKLSNNDKNEACNKLIKKWRNIKDNYIKSLKKKKPGGKDSRPYIYSQHLAFLNKGESQGIPNISLDKIEIDSINEDSMNTSSEHGGFDNWPTSCCEVKVKKRKLSEDSAPNEYVPQPSTSSLSLDFNADRSFFESILPSIYDFTEDQKLDFRSEVLNAIKRIRRSHY